MSGHSKWANIKHRKALQDAKKSKIFTRIIKEVQIAVKEGGPDPESNPGLRLAIQNAKGVNLPKDNLEKAISKASSEGENLQEISFEGYGPNGIAIFIESLTDNHQRTLSTIRSIFNKNGGTLGTNGSLNFLFDRKGVFIVPKKDINEEEFELEIIDAGVEDIDSADEDFILYCPMEDFGAVQKKLDALNIEAKNAELQRIPKHTTILQTAEAIKVYRMIEDFEEIDDVQNIYYNLEMTDELAEALEDEG
ncbi:YebC/PmpR family DNA-binding transcriptional regulator [Bacteroidota bacterium]